MHPGIAQAIHQETLLHLPTEAGARERARLNDEATDIEAAGSTFLTSLGSCSLAYIMCWLVILHFFGSSSTG